MFIEKMNVGNVVKFLQEVGGYDSYLKGKASVRITKINSKINVAMEDKETKNIVAIVLEDFSASSHSKEWIRFLYRKYGKTYKDAYEKHLSRILY